MAKKQTLYLLEMYEKNRVSIIVHLPIPEHFIENIFDWNTCDRLVD